MKATRFRSGAALALAAAFTLSGCASGSTPTPAAGDSTGSGAAKSLGIVQFDATSPIDNLFAGNTKKAFEGLGWKSPRRTRRATWGRPTLFAPSG
jgi:hypothetical protein